MTATGTEIQYRRLRAPREDGSVYIDPPLTSALRLLADNTALLGRYGPCDIHGQSLRELAAEARRLLLAHAHRYTAGYRNVKPLPKPGPSTPILISGHQPQLSHPGVWAKNFVLDRLARESHGVAVQLLIDNDLVRSATIRVPAGSIAQPHLEAVPIDRPHHDVPYEERAIQDPELFASFAKRAQRSMARLISRPLLEEMWPRTIEGNTTGRNLGQTLARARHGLEGTWGLATLELPLSQVCDTAPFRRFMMHLLVHAPTLQRFYNDSLEEYRRAHHIRSRSHPVANLHATDDWLETPFWIWTVEDARRRRLFIRLRDNLIDLRGGELSAGHGAEVGWDRNRRQYTVDCRPDTGIEQLAQLRRQGVKLRPRALITTMYARLVLGDLFVHGIGGSKYDQLTDVLMQRCLQISPPGFLTVSATYLLPIPRPKVTREDVRHVESLLRDGWYHPERHLDGLMAGKQPSDEVARLTAEKRRWIALPPPRGERLERHRNIERANEQMRRLLADQRDQWLRERGRLETLLRNETILASREYAFCLYPEQTLRGPLLQLAARHHVS